MHRNSPINSSPICGSDSGCLLAKPGTTGAAEHGQGGNTTIRVVSSPNAVTFTSNPRGRHLSRDPTDVHGRLWQWTRAINDNRHDRQRGDFVYHPLMSRIP